jgi:hypothetical protein
MTEIEVFDTSIASSRTQTESHMSGIETKPDNQGPPSVIIMPMSDRTLVLARRGEKQPDLAKFTLSGGFLCGDDAAPSARDREVGE